MIREAVIKQRKGLSCPKCGAAPVSIEKTPQGKRTCSLGHVWRMVRGVAVPEGPVPAPAKVDNPNVTLHVAATIGGCRMIVDAADHYGLADDLKVLPDWLDGVTTLRVQA